MDANRPAAGEHGATTLAVIAGGRARRLGGVPKGLLVYAGRTLLEGILALPADAVLLVTNDAGPYARFGLCTVPDVVPGRGAPGGVHAALAAARTPWVLAVAADMPFVSPAAVVRLLDARDEDVDAVGFEVAGRLEPLLALYRTALARRWEAALSDGPAFRRIWAEIRSRVLGESELRAVDPDARSVVSINTPGDAARWGVSIPA